MMGPPADGEKPPDLDDLHADSQGAVIAHEDINASTIEFYERPFIFTANKITGAQRYQRNIARSIYNANAIQVHENPGTTNFLLIAYDTGLMGEGNEWQEALAQHYGDDYLGFLAGASMEPSSYQGEQVMIGRVVLRIRRYDANVGKAIKLDIRTNTAGNAMQTRKWCFKLVAVAEHTKGTDSFPVGGIPATFGFEASDLDAWHNCQRRALTDQLVKLLSGPDGLWPTLETGIVANRFILTRKKHQASQEWFWRLDVLLQEHRQVVNDWLAAALPQAGTHKFRYTDTSGVDMDILHNYISLEDKAVLGTALANAKRLSQTQGAGRGSSLNAMLEYELQVEDRKRMLTDVLKLSDEEDAGTLEEANNLVLREAQTRAIARKLQEDDQRLEGEALLAAATSHYQAMEATACWQVDKMGMIPSTFKQVAFGPRKGKTVGCWWVIYSHREAAVAASQHIEGIQKTFGMPLLMVQNMGVKQMPVAKSSLYRKVQQQRGEAAQDGPAPAQPQSAPPPSGSYALAVAGDHSHAGTFVPPVPVLITTAQPPAQSPARKDLLAWKKSQEEKYEQQFLRYEEEAKATAAAAEQQRSTELAVIKRDNDACTTEMENLRSAMDSFQQKLMTDFGRVLDERLQAAGKHQTAVVEELKRSQELATARFEAVEANMQLLMSKLLGPEALAEASMSKTHSPSSSPATKKAKAVIIPPHALDGSGASGKPTAAGRDAATDGKPQVGGIQ